MALNNKNKHIAIATSLGRDSPNEAHRTIIALAGTAGSPHITAYCTKHHDADQPQTPTQPTRHLTTAAPHDDPQPSSDSSYPSVSPTAANPSSMSRILAPVAPGQVRRSCATWPIHASALAVCLVGPLVLVAHLGRGASTPEASSCQRCLAQQLLL